MAQKTLSLNDEDKGQLCMMLESQADLGAKFHGVVASELLKLYKATTDPAKRYVFGLEIFCKLMHILEDVGLFCLTWLDAQESGDPLKRYLNASTRRIIGFYERCAVGLTDQDVMVIHCIPTAEEAIQAGMLSQLGAAEYTRKVGVMCEAVRVVFKGFAAMYVEKPDGQIGDVAYGDVVNMYFNIKHGVKVLWPNRPLNKAFFEHKQVPLMTVPVLVGEREPGAESTARRGLHFAPLLVGEDQVQGMTANCYYVSNALSSMAQDRLRWLQNGGRLSIIAGSYPDLVRELHDGVRRARLPEEEKQAILAKWPQD